MPNKYANLVGTNKIKSEYAKITSGFALVETDINNVEADIGVIDAEMIHLEGNKSEAALVNAHIAGTASKHAAQDITYAGIIPASTTVKQAVESTYTRIGTIITTPVSGEAATQEIVDARNSAIKSTVYPSVDARLEAVEVDVEGTKTPAYSTPATVTQPIISLPSTALKGQLKTLLSGRTYTNLALNGNFANTDYWEDTSGSLVIANKIASFTPTAQYQSIYVSSIPFIANHKYYYHIRFKAVSTSKVFFISDNANFTNILAAHSGGGSYEIFSGIHTMGAAVDNTVTHFGLRNNSSVVYGEVNVDGNYGILFIDLTTTFGAGNEPDLATCDLMFPYWFDSTKSTAPMEVVVTGKNLVNGKNHTTFIGISLNDKLIDGETYTFSMSNSTMKIAISMGSGTTIIDGYNTVTFVFNKLQIWKLFVWEAINYQGEVINKDLPFQLELGAVATVYEPYTETKVYTPVLSSVPAISDTFDGVTGILTRNVSSKVLESADIDSYNLIDTHLDYIYISNLSGLSTTPSAISSSLWSFNYLQSDADLAANAYTCRYQSAGRIVLRVPSGAYADLAAAKAALTGTIVRYQLATPIVTTIEGMQQLMSEPSGSIIIEPAVKFEAKPATGVITIPSGWANIALIESVRKITMNPDGSISYETVIPSTNNATTITLPAGYDDTKFYEVVYSYLPELTTLPSVTYSYPTSLRGEIDSIGDMGRETAKNLDGLNDFTIAYLISIEARLTAHSI